ncbi:MAG: hypothetical protein FIA89_00060 [Geobacter sp.]|nr:hypothetical protein [Geobacter sp.]
MQIRFMAFFLFVFWLRSASQRCHEKAQVVDLGRGGWLVHRYQRKEAEEGPQYYDIGTMA